MYHFWTTHPMRFNPRLSTGRLVACCFSVELALGASISWVFNGFHGKLRLCQIYPDLKIIVYDSLCIYPGFSRKVIKATCFCFFNLVTFSGWSELPRIPGSHGNSVETRPDGWWTLDLLVAWMGNHVENPEIPGPVHPGIIIISYESPMKSYGKSQIQNSKIPGHWCLIGNSWEFHMIWDW